MCASVAGGGGGGGISPKAPRLARPAWRVGGVVAGLTHRPTRRDGARSLRRWNSAPYRGDTWLTSLQPWRRWEGKPRAGVTLRVPRRLRVLLTQHSAAAGTTSNNRRLSQCGGARPPSETLIHQEGESPAEVQCSIMPENSVQRAPENRRVGWRPV